MVCYTLYAQQTIQSIIEEKSSLTSQHESLKVALVVFTLHGYECIQQEYDKAEQECSHFKSLYEERKQEVHGSAYVCVSPMCY